MAHKRSYDEASGNNHNNNNHNGYNRNQSNNQSQPPSYKRQRLGPSNGSRLAPNTSMSSMAAPSRDQRLIAAHYGNRTDGGREDREKSKILQLRKLNNWTKSVLINMFCRPQSSVLDIGGGKGGDLNKWNFRKIEHLVHCDHALGSVQDCQGRYNEGLRQNRFQFAMKLICADAFQSNIMDSLDKNVYFDLVSSQFALHYAFETEQRVHAMLSNVTSRLREDGYFIGTVPDANVLVQKWRSKSPRVHQFGNSKYKVTFKCHSEEMDQRKRLDPVEVRPPFAIRYLFQLEGCVDCPEYLLHFDNFVKMAGEEPYNLELVLEANFHEFFARNIRNPEYKRLLQKLHLVDEYTGNGSIHNDQWDIAYLYKVFAFRKRRTEGRVYPDMPKTEILEISDDNIIVSQPDGLIDDHDI